MKYPAIATNPQPATKNLHEAGAALRPTIGDFWRWGFSNLLDNTTRAILAEFIVANSLGIADGTRGAWDSYDLRLASGVTIEVKTSAYLQTWGHKELSSIKFGIRRTRAWNVETNEYAVEQRRQADIYVFCLLAHQDKATVDPLDVTQWEFFILPTQILNERCGNSKSISLKALLALNPKRSTYITLKESIETIRV